MSLQNHSCDCGAYNASDAGYRQMSADDRAKWDRDVRNCATCRHDRRDRRQPARQEN